MTKLSNLSAHQHDRQTNLGGFFIFLPLSNLLLPIITQSIPCAGETVILIPILQIKTKLEDMATAKLSGTHQPWVE